MRIIVPTPTRTRKDKPCSRSDMRSSYHCGYMGRQLGHCKQLLSIRLLICTMASASVSLNRVPSYQYAYQSKLE
jgi:hypothetical protein